MFTLDNFNIEWIVTDKHKFPVINRHSFTPQYQLDFFRDKALYIESRSLPYSRIVEIFCDPKNGHNCIQIATIDENEMSVLEEISGTILEDENSEYRAELLPHPGKYLKSDNFFIMGYLIENHLRLNHPEKLLRKNLHGI